MVDTFGVIDCVGIGVRKKSLCLYDSTRFVWSCVSDADGNDDVLFGRTCADLDRVPVAFCVVGNGDHIPLVWEPAQTD